MYRSGYIEKYQTARNDFDFDDENRFENTPLVINTPAKMKKNVSESLSLYQLYTSWNGHSKVCSLAVILVV